MRARVITAIRRYLDDAGFVEVETPDPAAALRRRAARGRSRRSTTSSTATLYLRIATELYLKRLIVGGLERVYEIGKNFRNEGVVVQAQPRVHDARVVRGLRGLRRTDAPHRGARRRGGRGGERHDEVAVGEHEIDLAPPWRADAAGRGDRRALPASTRWPTATPTAARRSCSSAA